MNFLNYSLTAIVAYLGLLVGYVLSLIAKEELKSGKKYFIFLQKALLSLIFIFLLVMGFSYIAVLLLLACIVNYVMKNYLKKKFDDIIYTYIILSIIFYLSSKTLNLFTIEASLIFLYGLPTGTLLSTNSKKESTIDILKNIIFVVVAILLFLIF